LVVAKSRLHRVPDVAAFPAAAGKVSVLDMQARVISRAFTGRAKAGGRVSRPRPPCRVWFRSPT